MPAQPDLPLRPMTLGELLDAAMSLLRARALPLLAVAGVLAVLEQSLLLPLRSAAGATAPYYGPARGHFGDWWALASVGFGLEVAVITLLGAVAAAAAGPALLGRALPHRRLFRQVRPLATITTAVLAGLLAGAGAFAGFAPWVIFYGLSGLTAAVLVVDRSANPFTALGRSAKLAARGGLRGFWTLIAAYLTWFAVRFALGSGWATIASTIGGDEPGLLAWITPVAWALANAVAYSALACVGAVLLLETRIRTEGLDIAVRRARSRGEDDAAALVWAK